MPTYYSMQYYVYIIVNCVYTLPSKNEHFKMKCYAFKARN